MFNAHAETCSPQTRPNGPGILVNTVLAFTADLVCPLILTTPNPHRKNDLSPYWAQEYTGADLLRERIKNSQFSDERFQNLFAVWDSAQNDHGEKVSHLIQSTFPSAVIPRSNIAYTDLNFPGHYFENYEWAWGKCQREGTCPRYINNSMDWLESGAIAREVEKISEAGTVVVLAAGAEKSIERESARKNHVILVSSLTPSGAFSGHTKFNSEITISVPSNNELTTYLDDGSAVEFGGTSGAAPQVTGALAAFTLISGYALNTAQAKRLLSRTALPIPGLEAQGMGMLNAYKIGELAYKLQLLCPQTENNPQLCAQNWLSRDEFYVVNFDSRPAYERAQKAFPSCSESLENIPVQKSCQYKKEAFKELRRASFLDPKNSQIWRMLSCVLREKNLFANSGYYKNMSNHMEWTIGGSE